MKIGSTFDIDYFYTKYCPPLPTLNTSIYSLRIIHYSTVTALLYMLRVYDYNRRKRQIDKCDRIAHCHTKMLCFYISGGILRLTVLAYLLGLLVLTSARSSHDCYRWNCPCAGSSKREHRQSKRSSSLVLAAQGAKARTQQLLRQLVRPFNKNKTFCNHLSICCCWYNIIINIRCIPCSPLRHIFEKNFCNRTCFSKRDQYKYFTEQSNVLLLDIVSTYLGYSANGYIIQIFIYQVRYIELDRQ